MGDLPDPGCLPGCSMTECDEPTVIAPTSGTGRWVRCETHRERRNRELLDLGLNRHERRRRLATERTGKNIHD